MTDQLLTVASAAAAGNREKALELSLAARERHFNTASDLLGTGRFAQIHAELEEEFNGLDDLLRGVVAVGELTPRTTDNIAGFGERVSSKIVTAAFSVRGLNASHVDSRQCIVTDSTFTKAVPDLEETDARLRETVKPLLDHRRIPIMGGFIGATRDGISTTIGRGGSDFTAAIVGAGLEAQRIEIWTDVDGMMTTDPTLCREARRIKTISFEEAAELAYFGAKVLHPATLLPAMQKNIPVLILNSRRPGVPGTRIVAEAVPCDNVVKSIACKRKITLVNVQSTRMLMAHGFLHRIFEVFDRCETPVDMVATSEVSVSLTIDNPARLEEVLAELRKFSEVDTEKDQVIVCLVGEHIRYTP